MIDIKVLYFDILQKDIPLTVREKAISTATEHLKSISTPVSSNKEIYQIASISAGDDEIGKLIDGFKNQSIQSIYSKIVSLYTEKKLNKFTMPDVITDMPENLAAEQKARVTYDNILRLSDDPDVNDVIKFLREREIVHFQRFGEALQKLRENLDQKNVYAFNPSFDGKVNSETV